LPQEASLQNLYIHHRLYLDSVSLPPLIEEREICTLLFAFGTKTLAASRKKCIIYSFIIDIRFQ